MLPEECASINGIPKSIFCALKSKVDDKVHRGELDKVEAEMHLYRCVGNSIPEPMVTIIADMVGQRALAWAEVQEHIITNRSSGYDKGAQGWPKQAAVDSPNASGWSLDVEKCFLKESLDIKYVIEVHLVVIHIHLDVEGMAQFPSILKLEVTDNDGSFGIGTHRRANRAPEAAISLAKAFLKDKFAHRDMIMHAGDQIMESKSEGGVIFMKRVLALPLSCQNDADGFGV